MKTYTAKSSAHRAAKAAGLSKEAYSVVEVDGKFGYVPTAPTKVATGAKQVVSNVSVAAMPTKLVWEIAEQMFKLNPETRRKDVIAKCVDSGVAFNTARTQYQLWLTAHRASK